MTEVVATSSRQRHASAPTGPVTRSAMAARPGGASAGAAAAPTGGARQHESETSPAAAPLSSSGPHPPPSPPAESGESPPRRPIITRKRAASIDTEEANRPKIESLSLSTPSTASPQPLDASRDLICLCTPAPKVPRPRNAFILYRQHHQAQVVQQNPGLANPEISKIIGEQWRDEPEERKNQWKLLAEEEKQRHQRQYPDYRYQPRRGNKGGGGSQSTRPAAAPGEDPHRCPKCGGRYIATPRTPSTPFPTPTASKATVTPYGHPPSGQHLHHRQQHQQQQQQQQQSSASSSARSDMPRSGRSHSSSHWSTSAASAAHGGSAIGGSGSVSGSLYDIHEDYDGSAASAVSPETKRRRYNAAGRYHNFHALPSPPPPFSQPHHHSRQASLGMISGGSGSGSSSSNNPPSTPATATGAAGGGVYGPPPPAPGPAPASAPLPGPSSMLLSRAGGGGSGGSGGGRKLSPVGATTAMMPPPPPPPPPQAPRPVYPVLTSVAAAGGYQQPPPPPSARASGPDQFDESLRLPPLRTAALHPPPPVSLENGDVGGAPPGAGVGVGGAGLGIVHHPPHSSVPFCGGGGSSSTYPPSSSASSYPLYQYHGGGTTASTGAAAERERDAAARSVEAMVMSISFLNKLRVLERISPPLEAGAAASGSAGVGSVTRGPVIAIEGPDARLLRAVARVVERALRAAAASSVEGEGGVWEVRCWGNGSGGQQRQEAQGQQRHQHQRRTSGDVVMADAPGIASRHGSQASIASASVVSSVSGSGSGSGSRGADSHHSNNGSTNPFVAYLRTITEWHAKSAEIIDFITTTTTTTTTTAAAAAAAAAAPGALMSGASTPRTRLSTSSAASTVADPITAANNQNNTTNDPDSTPRPSNPTITAASTTATSDHHSRRPLPSHVPPPPHSHPPHPHPQPSSPAASTGNTTTAAAASASAGYVTKPRLPIALLPAGFSLTLSDRFACAVPIADAYAAVDHWQWMATLWRGIVGADLVVYVVPSSPLPSRGGGPSLSSSSSSAGPPSTSSVSGGAGGFAYGVDDPVGGLGGGVGVGVGVAGGGPGGTVEVRSAGLIVVRVPVAASSSSSSFLGVRHQWQREEENEEQEVAVDEKMERRLGFEVVEWVRGGGWLNWGRGADAQMAMEY